MSTPSASRQTPPKAKAPVAATPIKKPTPATKPEVVEAKPAPVPKANPVVLTPEEQAIATRVAQTDDSWRTGATEEGSEDFSLQYNMFDLPAPAQKLRDKKEFNFRWITRDPRRLDEMKQKPIPFKWWPVNSIEPVGGAFAAFIDPVLGCVAREDQMLVFKPWWMWERESKHKTKMADASYEAQNILSKKQRAQGKDVEVVAEAAADGSEEANKMRAAIRGTGKRFTGEDEIDAAAGVQHHEASEADLTVDS